MATNSPINLGLPQTPRLAPGGKEDVHAEFQMTYNAIRNLWLALTGIVNDGGEGIVNWGNIGGNIADQVDLVAALNAKLSDAASDGNIYGRKDGQWVIIPPPGGASSWGAITGNIEDQTDLWNILLELSGDIEDIDADILSIQSDITALNSLINTKIGEAPINGNEYVRKNGAWAIASGGGGGGGVHLPVVTGDIPPVFVYAEDGSLIYTQIE